MDFKDKIRTIPDFPIPGVQYRDITSLLEDPQVFNSVCTDMCFHAHKFNTDVIIGIESRGFIFAGPISKDLSLPFVLARKPGKLPNKTYKKDFDLEYGSTSIEIQKNTNIKDTDRVVIVDDLVATGGTAIACAELIHENFNVAKENILILSVIDLPELEGSKKIINDGYKLEVLVSYR